MKKYLLIAAFWLSCFAVAYAQELSSPNAKLKMIFALQADGTPTYTLKFKDKEVIKTSKLG